MKRTNTLVTTILSIVIGAAAQDKGMFAIHASVSGNSESPDQRSRVSLRLLDDNAGDFPTEVKVDTNGRALTSEINFGLNAEILWSSDSRAFSITGSSSGANGQYHTDVFLIESDRLRRIPLTPLVGKYFGHPVRCGWPEAPNVAAIKWLDGSSRLLVAAEIVYHSNCDSMGTFKGFVVQVRDQKVVKIYNQLTVKRLFGTELGEELRNADDSCIRDPHSCYVSTNHPELGARSK